MKDYYVFGINANNFIEPDEYPENHREKYIEELKDNWGRRLDRDNIIYLTESNHQLIHKLYRESPKKKKETMQLLFELVERYKKEFCEG